MKTTMPAGMRAIEIMLISILGVTVVVALWIGILFQNRGEDTYALAWADAAKYNCELSDGIFEGGQCTCSSAQGESGRQPESNGFCVDAMDGSPSGNARYATIGLPWGDYEGHRAQIVRSAVADSEKSGKVGVEVIRVNEDFGDVFYFYPNQDAAQDGVNHSLLVAHSLTMANKGVTNPFDEIKYQDVLTSPDGKYAVLSAACWEQDCYQIFDIEQRELHWVNAAAEMVSWTPENRLRLEGDCYTPMATACGPYESVSVSEPWIVAEVAQ